MTTNETTPAPSTPVAPAGYHSNPFLLVTPAYEAFKVNARAYILGIVAWIGSIFGVALVSVLLVVLVQKLAGSAGNVLAFVLGAAIVLAALYAVVRYVIPAAYRFQLAMAKHEKLSLREALDSHPMLGWKLLGTSFVAGLIILLGLILLLVPGIIFAVWFSFVPYVVIEEGLTGTAALSRSKQLVKGRFWDVFGLAAMQQSIGLLQVVPLLGQIASVVISILITPINAIRYFHIRELQAQGEEAVKAVRISPWNFVFIALAIVAISINAANSANKNSTTPDFQTTNLQSL